MLSAEQIKREAARLGFSACGLARARRVAPERETELRRWLADGCQGEMDYLARNIEMKLDSRLLVTGAKTIVSLAVNYYPGEIGGKEEKCDETGRSADFIPHLARYAYGSDYHDVVKAMLRSLMVALGLSEGTDGRCFVDTAPVDEKYWAVQAGLGWRGRNSLLIIPGGGSYFFLGELILIDEADVYDSPITPRCGHCTRCIDACPTQALRGDGTMDARRCLSYLTIEYRGDLPDGTGKQMGDCIYGCDRCAEACPYNARFPRPTEIDALRPRAALKEMSDADWRTLTVERYREIFRKSAVKRAKYEGLMRNIAAVEAAKDMGRSKTEAADE